LLYYHGKPLHVLRHDGQWWLHSGDVLALIGRRLGSRMQQLLAAEPTYKTHRKQKSQRMLARNGPAARLASQ
jgi:prophage antirepressor-like protein